MYEPILQPDAHEAPDIRSSRPKKIGRGVLDDATFKVLEVDRLFDVVNDSLTVVGQATLYRSFTQPLDTIDAVKSKQEATRELESNHALRENLENLVINASKQENDFFNLLYGTFLGIFGNPNHKTEFEGYGYESYRKGTQFMLDLTSDAELLSLPESTYLKTQIQAIRDFAQSRDYALMRGPAYITEKGVKTKAEKHPLMPAIIFRPTLFKPLLIASIIGIIVLLSIVGFLSPFGVAGSASPAFIIFGLPLAIVIYAPIIGGFDRDSCIYPIREAFKNSSEVQSCLEALGKIDELLSFYRYGKSFGSFTVLPRLKDSDEYSISLKRVRNPILAKINSDYVSNNVDFSRIRLTLITGPNSGGKTAICKTVAQVQLLTQIGCVVPADDVETVVANRIFYQVPEFSSLEYNEGRFGTELKRTKEIFLASSTKSLVILDELSEGTTYEEKLETSFNVLNGFYKKGINTVLITHNHELVDNFMKKGVGQALQVEFKGHEPTYKLIEGISRVSHADRVARNIGFSKEDIERYLTDKEDE